MKSYKDTLLHKQALLGKGIAIKWLQELLRKTVNNHGRSAFIQGVKYYGGGHPLTQTGRFINQHANKVPSTAPLKDYLNKFLTRPARTIDWAPKQGVERIDKAIYKPQGNIRQLLNRLSRRTMWTPDTVVTYTDHPVTEAKRWRNNRAVQNITAKKKQQNSAYDSMQEAMEKLRAFSSH